MQKASAAAAAVRTAVREDAVPMDGTFETPQQSPSADSPNVYERYIENAEDAPSVYERYTEKLTPPGVCEVKSTSQVEGNVKSFDIAHGKLFEILKTQVTRTVPLLNNGPNVKSGDIPNVRSGDTVRTFDIGSNPSTRGDERLTPPGVCEVKSTLRTVLAIC